MRFLALARIRVQGAVGASPSNFEALENNSMDVGKKRPKYKNIKIKYFALYCNWELFLAFFFWCFLFIFKFTILFNWIKIDL